MMMKHEGALAFGCGCNKSQGVVVSSRTTTYQVVGSDQAIVAEFSNLPEARTKAIEVNGRVKVTSKGS